MSADTREPSQPDRTPAPIHDISNALHAKWCSDIPNDGTYTFHLNEVETIRFFEMTDRLVAAAVSAACEELQERYDFAIVTLHFWEKVFA